MSTFTKVDFHTIKMHPYFPQICSLMRGGIAERGGIRVGHRIIEINGQSVVATPHDKIIQILTNAVGEVRGQVGMHQNEHSWPTQKIRKPMLQTKTKKPIKINNNSSPDHFLHFNLVKSQFLSFFDYFSLNIHI